MMTQLDDEAALLNIKTGKYFSLNATGVRIWELLSENHDTEEIFNILNAEYGIDKDILRADFEHLLTKLQEAELVRLR
ncbi:MAG TPA: PqqD family protein [Syntrophomonadaceae bacterium]|nr:PqqD family protein [Syntrophomonadaceae bacterium]